MSFGCSFALHPVIDLLKRTVQLEEDGAEGIWIEKMTQRVLRLSDEMHPILPYRHYLLSCPR